MEDMSRLLHVRDELEGEYAEGDGDGTQTHRPSF
jgi:hypothetical protein